MTHPCLFLVLLAGYALPASAEVNITGNYTSRILPLVYRSKEIPWADWISLLTLCLAPLFAHIIAGVPQPSYLTSRKPRWHDKLGLYNPTSILWRYFAIADRRLRARNWARADLAAVNAVFWTSHGWDCSEEMAATSSANIIKLPEKTYTKLLSTSSLKSLIVTVQGVQSIYVLVFGLRGGLFGLKLAVDSIFGPLAVFGLLRLCAAPWLTDDYVYSISSDEQFQAMQDLAASKPYNPAATMKQPGAFVSTSGTHTAAAVSLLNSRDLSAGSNFRPRGNWRSWVFRVVYLLPIAFLWCICILYFLPANSHKEAVLSSTTFSLALFYFGFLSISLLLYTYYFIRGFTGSTVIPCLSTMWYKIYTAISISVMLALIVVASIETRQTTCGKTTTWPEYITVNEVLISADEQLCPNTITISSNSDMEFGVATRGASIRNGTVVALEPGQFRVADFDGYCRGTPGEIHTVAAVNGSSGS